MMECYSAMKRTAILPFAKWIDLEGIMFSEICQAEKGKYCMISHEASKKAELVEREGRMVLTRGWKRGMGKCQRYKFSVKR